MASSDMAMNVNVTFQAQDTQSRRFGYLTITEVENGFIVQDGDLLSRRDGFCGDSTRVARNPKELAQLIEALVAPKKAKK